ncbi:MAG TPA: hypothetical protein VF017_17535 [Thermoanaerobaculia bacterium]|nr:hypothetical protein [Thermoanaerobaculia bacterium]
MRSGVADLAGHGRPFAVLTLSFLVGALPWLLSPSPPPSPSPPNSLDSLWTACSRAFRDPETGRLTAPPPGRATRAPLPLRPRRDLVETRVEGPGGGFRLDLEPSPPPSALRVKSGAVGEFELVNLDGPGEGFNDPAPFTPEGGNTAGTLGAARWEALSFALSLWAESLASPVPIRVGVRFEPLGGTAEEAVLGIGGPQSLRRDFAGAPQAGTWYPSALADKLSGQDLDGPDVLDARLTFNRDVDGPFVLGSAGFSYGLDDRAPGDEASFLRVVLHELAHGLGFLDLIDPTSGAELLGHDDVFTRLLVRRGATPAAVSEMTDAERLAAMVAAGEIFWTGAEATTLTASLTAGRSPEGWVEMAASPGNENGAFGHFATAATPDQLLEPFYAEAAEVARQSLLTRAVLADLGWGPAPGCAAPPAASTTLLVEDFADGDFAGWTITSLGPTNAPAAWAVTGGELAQTSNIYGDPLLRGTFAAWAAGSSWTDYRFGLRIRSSDDDTLGVMFRVQDANNFYRFDMDKQQSRRRLLKVVGGSQTILAQDTVAYRQNDTMWVEVSAVGDQLTVEVDGWPVFSATDGSLASGTIALATNANAGSYFDHVVVERPPATAPAVLATDDFQDGNYTGWTKVDIGTTSAPSTWSATAKYLAQTSNIYGDPYSRGTLVHFAAGSAWTDVRAGLTLWSADDDQISVYFRFQDASHFYRFDWDRQLSRRRLIKLSGTTWTVLALDAVPYVVNEQYYLELIARGDQLEVRVDGVTALAATDGELSGGTVALGCSGNAGSYFDNVRVKVATGGGL